ncbi:hypothetical protein AAG570_001907 [Ranatra chinensis]|uniref:Protein eyes shut homolog n=1 Tax=Ranatra chinensis TaxID=642074 RepID=A0ABD0YLS6_9HEMI
MGLERRCSAMLRVNNSLAMSGEQPAVPGPALHNTGALYLGGLPQHILHQVDIPVKNGVIACMYSLQIDGEKKEIYEDAVDGFSVTECSSLACLSSPCLNGGSCVESGHNWHCLCSNGYVGNKCEDSVCKNNPCNFGGTCVQYPGSGFACLCPLGKHGLYCDQDLEIGQPYFSSSIGGLSSYTAYPLPGAIHHSFELRFHFIPSTMDQIALMIFIGQDHPHDPTSDHLAVSFIKGYVVLTWNLGSGPRRIFTPHPVADSGRGKQTHIVRLGRIGQQGWLQVDNMPNITGTSPGWLSQLNTEPILFVGGYESHNFSGLPHDLPLHSGYTGCLYGVELRAGRVRLFPHRSKDAKGRNVGQCSTRHCHDSTCLHGGACLDHAATFSCLCHDGWFGAECSMSSNPCDSTRHNCSQGSTCVPLQSGYECDCPLGKSGKHCEVDEPLSDVSFSGKRSYLSLESVDIDGPEACIDLQLKPMSERGLVLFMQQNQGPTVTFISLSLHGGILELRISPLGGQRRAGDVLVVRSGRVLAMGEWTTVRAGRYGRRVFLSVDGTVNAGNLLPGETLLPGNKPLYIGGVPDLSNLPSGSVAGGLPAPLKGCVRKLRINWQPVALTTTATATTAGPLEGRNLIDCDGTLCGADICHNGGTCQLTPDKKPTCSCPKVTMKYCPQ